MLARKSLFKRLLKRNRALIEQQIETVLNRKIKTENIEKIYNLCSEHYARYAAEHKHYMNKVSKKVVKKGFFSFLGF